LAIPTLFPHAGSVVWKGANVGTIINGVFQVVKVRNMVLGGGVLPSGNDVKGVILGDVVGAFLIGLPLAIVLGLYTPLGIAGIFLARAIEETGKLGIFSWRERRLKWPDIAAAQLAIHAEA